MKKFVLTISLLAIIALNSACKFPDNLPDWQNINDFQLNKIIFEQTTPDDFKKLVPDAKAEQATKNIIIFNTQADKNELYNKVRVGFKDNKLDWIEYTLSKELALAKFIEIYDRPKNINNTYSNTLDYYDYGFFNISTDKDHIIARHLTIFKKPEALQPKIDLSNLIPSPEKIHIDSFMDLKPGLSLESEFLSKYPELSESKVSNSGTESVYVINSELGKKNSQYKKATLSFNNSLLSWISISPKNLTIDQAIKHYGQNYKVEQLDSKYDIYDYSNFVLVVDRTQKTVADIGILAKK